MSGFSEQYPANDSLCRLSSVTTIVKPALDTKVFLSAKADGKSLDLLDRVDTSGRQLWKFQGMPGSTLYRIIVAAGTGRKCFLSASSTTNHVDLLEGDDGSGRQQWHVIPHPTFAQAYYIRIREKCAARGCNLLSARFKENNDIKLFSNDYGSGRQIWLIKPHDAFFANDGGEHPRENIFYHIQVLKGKTCEIPERLYLSSNSAGKNLDMFFADDGSGRQRWVLRRIGNRMYNIVIYGGITSNDFYLSTSKDNSVVDLYTKDDKSGRQQWKLEHYYPPHDTAYDPSLYRISVNACGVNDTRRIFLTTAADGNSISLEAYQETNRRQLWRLEVIEDRRWSIDRARHWQNMYGYRAGMNFLPSTASNQLEMFQAATYDPITIERELGYAEAIGFNCLRVFLHDLLWEEEGFLDRVDHFLSLADAKNMVVMLVFLDGCWYEHPQKGAQPEPIHGMHNSRWVQSPGSTILYDWTRFLTLQSYIQGVVRRFQHDPRVLAWDVWNEPSREEYPDALLLPRLMVVMDWIRAIQPSQPLTTAITQQLCGTPRLEKGLEEIVRKERQRNRHLDSFQQVQCQVSDVISFHLYKPDDELREHIEVLGKLYANRPMICSEYFARPKEEDSQVSNLRILKAKNVYAMHWGLVAGKSHTIFSRPYRNHHFDWHEVVEDDRIDDDEDTVRRRIPEAILKEVWFHDLLYTSGEPYQAKEVEEIKRILRS